MLHLLLADLIVIGVHAIRRRSYLIIAYSSDEVVKFDIADKK